MSKTAIPYLEEVLNVTSGCTPVSEGCYRCWASDLHRRFQGQAFGPNCPIKTHPERLAAALRWRTPKRVGVCFTSDLFHERVPDEFIDKVFAVMALTPQHTYLLLTKRPERMREYLSALETPFRVTRAMDAISVAHEITALGPEEERPIEGFPGYYVTNYGRVLSSNGSATCLFCGGLVEGLASKAYCSKKCRQNANFYRRTGRSREGARTLTEMKPMPGTEGHLRVMLYVDGEPSRELVHRLVLTAFVRAPDPGEQGCHRDGDATNNALPNLRWGMQSENWRDRKRHGNAHSYGERQGVEPEIAWPLANCWAGVSCENQARADERIPLLLETPAAHRWISCEPLLGAVDLSRYVGTRKATAEAFFDSRAWHNAIGWCVVGGESGPHARPCDLGWIRAINGQCDAAGVKRYVKQLGSVWAKGITCTSDLEDVTKQPWPDFKGEDWDYWPPDLRVREISAEEGSE